MNKNTATNFIKYTILTLIFIIPFIFLIAPSDPGLKNPNHFIFFANYLFFPFITSKAFVFRIIVEIIFTLWLILMLRDKKYIPKSSWLSVAVTVFAIIALIADIAGVNPLRSIWSNFERMEGWMVIVHMWAYFIVLGSVFTERKYWYRLFNTSLFVAILISIYGLVQLGGGAMIHQGSTRIDASLGNAIYLAVYILFHIFIAIYMSYVSWHKKHKVFTWIYAILAVLFLFILFETSTRGTIIGFLGGGIVSLVYLSIFEKKNKILKHLSWIIVATIILLGVLFYLNKNAQFIQNNETLRRLSQISWQDTKTQARGYIWPMAIKGAFESPKTAIIGYGQENFNYVFNKNYSPKMWNQESWFDRVHNVFLDWLIAGGIIGLLAYLSLFVISMIFVWRSDLPLSERAILIGLIVAYGIHNVFVFDNLASYVFFFTILAFVHTVKNTEKHIAIIEKNIKLHDENFVILRDYLGVPIIVVLFALVLYFINVRPIQANSRLITALNFCNYGQKNIVSPNYFKRALALDQYMANQEIREQLLICTGTIVNGEYSNDQRQAFLDFLDKEVKNQIKITPNDARIYTLAGSFYNSIGKMPEALPLLEKAHELSPNKQQIIFQLAGNYVNSGKSEQALELYKKNYELEPTYENAKSTYIAALLAYNKEAEARKIFTNPNDFDNNRIAQIYASMKKYDLSIAIYKRLIEKDPKNVDYLSQLAQIQYTAGMKSASVETLKMLISGHPELKDQIEKVIKQIQGEKK